MAKNIDWAKMPNAVEDKRQDSAFLHNIAATDGTVRTVQHSDSYVNALYFRMIDRNMNECTLFLDSIESIDCVINALELAKRGIKREGIQLGPHEYAKPEPAEG